MAELNIFLDQNAHFPLKLRTESGQLHVELDLSNATNSRFKRNIADLLSFTFANGKQATLEKQNDTIYTLTTSLDGPGFDMRLSGRDIMAFGSEDLSPAPMNAYGGLTNFECRMLGRANNAFLRETVPFGRTELHQLNGNLEEVRPKTELHTHLTSEISADNLLRVAEEQNALYPAELLIEALGIERDELKIARGVRIQPTEFAPMSGKGLQCERAGEENVEAVYIKDLTPTQRKTLKDALEIPTDRVYTFDDLERKMYRFRNPFTKNDRLIGPIILAVAEQYAKQGIAYTEQSVTGALKPAWLEKALPALDEAKEKYGVDMRFLVGIPRNFAPDRMLREIDRLKHCSLSPHIVGVDFLGYEANKTDNFGWALRRIAEFAANRPKRIRADGTETTDFVLRVHAGENGKNLDNVQAAMEIANEYNMPLRIGHGIYVDMTPEFQHLAKEMAEKGLIVVEFNPDSNMANNNVDCPTDIPVKQWQELGVPCVISSDGSGAYQTDTLQLIQSMLAAGMSIQDLQVVRQFEERYIERQNRAYDFRSKDAPSDAKFMEDYFALEDEQKANGKKLRPILQDKTPILIAGASGKSWQRIDEEQRTEIEVGVRMLTKLLDDGQAYFCVGRVKDEGVTRVLDEAIGEVDESGKTTRNFALMGLLSQLQNMISLPKHLTDIWPLDGGLMATPTEMINFIHEQKGMAILVGGGSFTSDFVLNAEDKEIEFGVMQGPEGASTDKGRVTDKEHHFADAISMVHQVQQMAEKQGLTLFKDGVDLSEDALTSLRKEIEEEVLDARYPDLRAMQASVQGRAR